MEHVRSAIRSLADEAETVVYTSADRWLVVRGYSAERQGYNRQTEPGPMVARLDVIRETDNREFYWNCAHVDGEPPYREELTAAGPQLVIPGCERRPIDNGKPAQLSLF